MTSSHSPVTVDVRLPDDWATTALRDDIRRAFTHRPIVLPPAWLYDDTGSDLFDQITRLAEYYPTEAERAILTARSDEIVARTDADVVVELGSGTSDKTTTLLDAFARAGRLRSFVPVDVSQATLTQAAGDLAERYPGVDVHAVVGDFTRHLGALPVGGNRMVVFLGGTIGNFYREERAAFLGALADVLRPGEWLLLGVDLVKNIDRILDAYDDPEGLTERFITNVLTVLNNQLGADFDLDGFDYAPMWDRREERVDIRLRSSVPQRVRLAVLDLAVELGEGEEIRVEVSTKFRPERLRRELGEAGLELVELWTDPNHDFGLGLAQRR
ncbi:MAG: L-histidine N(alpha)-methyltransferase [Acidimicrobiales bacterium]